MDVELNPNAAVVAQGHGVVIQGGGVLVGGRIGEGGLADEVRGEDGGGAHHDDGVHVGEHQDEEEVPAAVVLSPEGALADATRKVGELKEECLGLKTSIRTLSGEVRRLNDVAVEELREEQRLREVAREELRRLRGDGEWVLDKDDLNELPEGTREAFVAARAAEARDAAKDRLDEAEELEWEGQCKLRLAATELAGAKQVVAVQAAERKLEEKRARADVLNGRLAARAAEARADVELKAVVRDSAEHGALREVADAMLAKLNAAANAEAVAEAEARAAQRELNGVRNELLLAEQEEAAARAEEAEIARLKDAFVKVMTKYKATQKEANRTLAAAREAARAAKIKLEELEAARELNAELVVLGAARDAADNEDDKARAAFRAVEQELHDVLNDMQRCKPLNAEIIAAMPWNDNEDNDDNEDFDL